MLRPRNRCKISPRTACTLLLGGLTVALAGCSNLDAVDRRIARVLGESSGQIGTIEPRINDPRLPGERSSLQYEPQPATNNPPADELGFTPADPERDVLARLQGFGVVTGEPVYAGIVESLRLAQMSSREYIAAEEEYILAVIRLLIERHRWGPRFFNDTTMSSNIDSIDGRYTTALRVINELRATQRLPYGGDVEARLVTQAAQQLIDIAGDDYTQSSQLVLSASIPLLRNAGLVAREDIIQAERDLVYAARDFERFRRSLLVDVADDYFSLVAQLGTIRNLKQQVFSFEQLFEQRKALVEAEREPAFEAQNVEQRLLDSKATLESARENYRLSLDRFKVRLGLPVSTNLVLTPDALELPDPEISPTQAAEVALALRLDLQNARDRIDDQRRDVAIARNQLLPDLDLTASAALSTDGEPNESSRPNFDLDDTDYAFGVTFGLPLDREIERLGLRSSIISLRQSLRNFDEFRDNTIVQARAAVRNIDRARNDLALRELAVRINSRRLEEFAIRADEIDTQDVIDAQTDQLSLENALENARLDLRNAILEYLLATGQLRVEPDGTLDPLPGMDVRIVASDDPILAEPFQDLDPDDIEPADLLIPNNAPAPAPRQQQDQAGN